LRNTKSVAKLFFGEKFITPTKIEILCDIFHTVVMEGGKNFIINCLTFKIINFGEYSKKQLEEYFLFIFKLNKVFLNNLRINIF
jgi:hypothetical protein